MDAKFADDLLQGAAAIAEFLFGDRRLRRKVYHLAETTRLPVFRIGSKLCARQSVLLRWIGEQEQRVRRPQQKGAEARQESSNEDGM